MYEFFADSANAGTIGTVFFFMIFCYILFKNLRPSKKKEINDLGSIPLRDD